MMQFAWPWMWVLLLLPAVFWLALPALKTAPGMALRVPFVRDWEPLQPRQVSGGRANRLNLLIATLAWCALVGAAARPQWVGDIVRLPLAGRDLMLAVDTSGSMERPDFVLNGNAIDRLTAVKAIAGEFIQGRQGDRVGLILFGQRAYLQTPLTFDRTTARTMLNEAEIGIAGKETAIGDAIGLAIKRLQQRPQNSRVLILLTDGANTAGEVEPAQAAQLAKTAGLRIHTIGIGADRMEVPSFFGTQTVNPSADLDENTLRLIADTTGGSYFRARDTTSLEGVYEQINALEPVQSDSKVFRPIDELFFWPLAASYAFLVLLSVRLGWLGLSVSVLPGASRK